MENILGTFLEYLKNILRIFERSLNILIASYALIKWIDSHFQFLLRMILTIFWEHSENIMRNMTITCFEYFWLILWTYVILIKILIILLSWCCLVLNNSVKSHLLLSSLWILSLLGSKWCTAYIYEVHSLLTHIL